jgi:hypothetical protein
MPGRLTKLLSARFARASDTSASPSKFFNPERSIVIGAVTLAIIAVSSAGFIVYNLHNRVISENERALKNSALIIARSAPMISSARAKTNALENDCIVKETALSPIS